MTYLAMASRCSFLWTDKDRRRDEVSKSETRRLKPKAPPENMAAI